jgi:hypothetical protein
LNDESSPEIRKGGHREDGESRTAGLWKHTLDWQWSLRRSRGR